VIVCLERGADCLRMVHLMPLHLETPSSLDSFKSRLVLPAYRGCPGARLFATGVLLIAVVLSQLNINSIIRNQWTAICEHNTMRYDTLCVLLNKMKKMK